VVVVVRARGDPGPDLRPLISAFTLRERRRPRSASEVGPAPRGRLTRAGGTTDRPVQAADPKPQDLNIRALVARARATPAGGVFFGPRRNPGRYMRPARPSARPADARSSGSARPRYRPTTPFTNSRKIRLGGTERAGVASRRPANAGPYGADSHVFKPCVRCFFNHSTPGIMGSRRSSGRVRQLFQLKRLLPTQRNPPSTIKSIRDVI